MLESQQKLRILRLTHCDYEESVAKSSQPFSVRYLNLYDCNLTPKILLQFIKSFVILKELMINYLAFDCNCDNVVVLGFCKECYNKCYRAISRMPSIKVLRIYSVYCISAFLDSIVNYQNLETVEVFDDPIYFKRLMEILSIWPKEIPVNY